ncbi:hypothetical protein ACWGJX_46660 [Streptomyces sp. NPDC054775]
MAQLKYELFAVDPQGVEHTIAAGNCVGCATLVAANTGYRCIQNFSAGSNCAGAWVIRKTSVYTAPPGNTWTSMYPGCTAAGVVLTCTASSPAGTARLFNDTPPTECPAGVTTPEQSRLDSSLSAVADENCVQLPDGVEMPELDALAISNIRESHFPGGAKADSTKGLFFSSITDSQLEGIFQAGLKYPSTSFVRGEFYYEKSFPVANVGARSVDSGGGPSYSIVLVIDAYGTVITMYPA